MAYIKSKTHFKYKCNMIKEDIDYISSYADTLSGEEREAIVNMLNPIREDLSRIVTITYKRVLGRWN